MSKITQGGVSIKTIHNKKYFYYQWYENGKRRSKTISEEEYYKIKNGQPLERKRAARFNNIYNLDVLTGDELLNSVSFVSSWAKRDCFDTLLDFLRSPANGKLMTLYGLRRTGKTTLMYQAIISLKEEIDNIAYVLLNNDSTMGDLNLLLNDLSNSGYKYIFIDEITLAKDFISSCQFLSDIYALKLKIVISGTDSLGFYIASKEGLYNRSYMIHTTYIPFKEFSRVLNINDVDTYIKYGGTLVIEGANYHKNVYPTFFDEKTSIEYVDTAISRNIQNSLSNYNDGEKYPRLIGARNANQLTNIINRVVQDNNHRFVASVINRTFKSQDYGSLKELLRKNKQSDFLRTYIDQLDDEKIYQTLMDKLDILDSKVEQDTLDELYKYFQELDLIDSYRIIDLENRYVEEMNVFVQPGLRYSQAKELLETLLYQDELLDLPIELIDIIFSTLLNDVKGRILEEIVLIENSKNNRSNVFKASFRIGEIDMCIYNPVLKAVDLYEIKHSKDISIEQIKNLTDEHKDQYLIRRYGKINKRFVLYRGKNMIKNNIEYINVEEFLKRKIKNETK